MNTRKYILFILLLLGSTSLLSQEIDDSKTSSPFYFEFEFLSRYIWRGLNAGGNTPSMQPTIGVEFARAKHSLALEAFGVYSVGGQFIQEVDMTLSYTYNDFLTLALNDYFNTTDDLSGPSWFDLRKSHTGHLLEGAVQFNGTEKIPFNAFFGMNFYGDDALRINADGSDGKIMRTTYFEVGYTKMFTEMQLDLFLGGSLTNPDATRGETGYYDNTSAGITNFGLKLTRELQFKNEYTIPMHTSFIVNPKAEAVFIVFGIVL
ncbi:MAG: hypothetical protein R6V49_11200 [Bacteroidales bacterium]